MEDIDPARSHTNYAHALVEDLHWLGLDWDEGPSEQDILGLSGPYAPYTQSVRTELYKEALHTLTRQSVIYPCFCTRKELRALAGAPHISDEGAPYPGTCRLLTKAERAARFGAGRKAALRIRYTSDASTFDDGVFGQQHVKATEQGADFALQRSDGVIAYQLAVTVDDGLMGITQVVRGRDILGSTPRQIYLLRLLGFSVPEYVHVPLVLDADGERLAKRHETHMSIRLLRESGISPEAILGLLACRAGLQEHCVPASPTQLLAQFPQTFPSWWRTRDITLERDLSVSLRKLT